MIPTSPRPMRAGCCRNPIASATSTGPHGWTRRKFLQAVGGGIIGGAVLGSFGSDRFGLGRLGFDLPAAFAGTPIGAHDGIVVNIVLYGGNDGLNTVVPYTNWRYYEVRGPNNGNLAIPAGTGAATRRHVRAAPEPDLHQVAVGRRPAGHRPRRRLSEPGSVALHVDGDLDERQLRCRSGVAPAGSAAGSMVNRRRPPI